MKYRTFGRTGWRVSEIGFGAWAIGGNRFGNSYGLTGDETSKAALRKALDLGCNFLDTADIYGHGHSEELIGEVVGNRKDIFVGTKVGGNFYGRSAGGQPLVRMDFSPEYIEFACDQSLNRLKRDAIDLYLLHNPPLEYIERDDIFGTLDRLKEKGKVREVGVSIHQAAEGLAALKHPSVAAVQVVFNVFRVRDALALREEAGRAGAALIAREPLSNGLLTGKYGDQAAWNWVKGDLRGNFPAPYLRSLGETAQKLKVLEVPGRRTLAQAALQFILREAAIATVIPGCKTPEQAAENLTAGDAPPLSARDIDRLRRILEDASRA